MDLLTLIFTKLALMGFVLGLRWVLLQVVEGLRVAARPRVIASPAPPVLPPPPHPSQHPENSVPVGTVYDDAPTPIEPRVWGEGIDVSRTPEDRRRRLLDPDFGGVAGELGVPLPRTVKEFYRNLDDVVQEDIVVHAPRWGGKTEEWPIRHFMPADSWGVMGWNIANRNLGTFRFAMDPIGNHYVIRPDREDPPVWVQQRGTGRMTFVCARFPNSSAPGASRVASRHIPQPRPMASRRP